MEMLHTTGSSSSKANLKESIIIVWYPVEAPFSGAPNREAEAILPVLIGRSVFQDIAQCHNKIFRADQKNKTSQKAACNVMLLVP
eukprot:6247714-Amphidinium_carterae.1